jgi:drug/metabolite transporter (DMT)-like permease
VPLHAALLLVLINVIWAGSSVTGKTALEVIGPFTLILARFAPSCLLLFLLVRFQRKPLKIERKDYLRLFLVGLLGIPVTYGIFYSGMVGSSATEANLVIAAEPIIIALLAMLFLKEHLSKVRQVGLLVGFAGLYVLIMRGFLPRFEGAALSNSIMTAALLFECYASITGKSLTDTYPGLVVVMYEFGIGSLIALPFAVRELTAHHPHHLGLSGWCGLAYLSLACSFFSYGVWYWLLPKYNISAMSGFLFVQPMAGPILAYIFRHEPLYPATFVGAALVIVGVWLVAFVGGKETPPVLSDQPIETL